MIFACGGRDTASPRDRMNDTKANVLFCKRETLVYHSVQSTVYRVADRQHIISEKRI